MVLEYNGSQSGCRFSAPLALEPKRAVQQQHAADGAQRCR